MANELPSERAGGSLLIVEGCVATRQALAELLAESDYVVHTASGVHEMTRVCGEMSEKLDVVLLEFRLRDGRGDRAAELVRKRWPNATIIFLSCVQPDQDDALGSALREARTALLLKPTSLEAILRALGTALSQTC